MCFAAKWHGEREIMFSRNMRDAFDLLTEADAVISWNGDRFDEPHLNTVFELEGWGVPKPFARIDLLKTSRKKFKFPSNKLDYVAGALLGEHKATHQGFKLWRDCMNEDERAWKTMERYNKQDVRITERVYDRLLPWITTHPSVPMLEGRREGCPNCGSLKAQRRGYAYTASSQFQQWQCQNPKCGRWYRGATRLGTTEARGL